MIKCNNDRRTSQIQCWLKPEEHKIIAEAVAKVEAAAKKKIGKSYFIRHSVIRNAERIVGRHIEP